MSKLLQKDSVYNEFDMNDDGMVSDEELTRSERIVQIENMDKLADQQRLMAWFALALPFVTIIILATPYISADKAAVVMGLATTFCASMGTIVVAFMAATAYIRGKMD